MCGIVGCISTKQCATNIFHGLKQLKNRGYDSVGIASLRNTHLQTDKFAATRSADCYDLLEKKIPDHVQATTGIGHTRWATHGQKTDANSHPHTSQCGKFSLVHNGIIENYQEIKERLISLGYRFISQTDTEVIVQLLSYEYTKNDDVYECIRLVNCQLEGTWGIAVLCVDLPDTIYCTRRGSPLLVGYDDTIAIVASEKSGFCGKIVNYMVLKPNDICRIELKNDKVIVTTTDLYYPKQLRETERCELPSSYQHWTLKEIHEQYDSSLRVVSLGGRLLDNDHVKLGGMDGSREQLIDVQNIVILGCGTSFLAGMYGSHFLKELGRFNTVQVFDGADFSENDIPRYGKTACILISQSGETMDLINCIQIARNNDLFLVGVVNVVDSLIAREVDCGCYLNAGREVGVASTKAFTSQVIMLSMIAVWFAQEMDIHRSKRAQYVRDIRSISRDIKDTLKHTGDQTKTMATTLFKDATSCFVIGKGKSECVAREGSLKLKEISYIHSEGYSSSSLKHGPFALLEKGFPVIMVSPENEHSAKTEGIYEEIISRDAEVVFITNRETAHSKRDKKNVILVSSNQTFADLLCVIPLQLLAYHLSVLRGYNPDMPRNLAKVVTV